MVVINQEAQKYTNPDRDQIDLGRLGEHKSRIIRFTSARDIFLKYPNASVTILHQRPKDPAAYPVSPAYISVDNEVVFWEIQSGDVAKPGVGKAQLVFRENESIVKTLIYITRIGDALDGSEDPPQPWESWVAQVIEAGEHAPTIRDGVWYAWDTVQGEYVNTHVSATGPAGNGIQATLLNSDYTLTIRFTDGTSYTTAPIRGPKGDAGNGITGTVMNADYTMTIMFADGTSYTTPPIRGERGEAGNGIRGTTLNNDYTLTISFTDGTQYTTQPIRGAKGDTGVSVQSVRLNDDYTLTVTLTDGTAVTTDPIRGEKGDVGNGIASTVLNNDYTLTITMDDGTSYTTPSIRGAKGDTGKGIASTVLNSNYTLTITFTDGTRYTTPSIRGEPGHDYIVTPENVEEISGRVANSAIMTNFKLDVEGMSYGTQSGQPVPSTSPYYEDNAKYYSEAAAVYAAQAEDAANNSGYMDFEIDASGHLIYEHTRNLTGIDFALEGGRLVALWE